MKRVIRIAAFLLLAATLCAVFVGCRRTYDVVFDKKYLRSDGTEYYVFHSDKTGYFEIHRGSGERRYSGSIEFVWRRLDDGTLYLIGTKVTYDEDHTYRTSSGTNAGISITSYPVSFGDEIMLTLYSGTYGGGVNQYVLEGSKLEEELKGD